MDLGDHVWMMRDKLLAFYQKGFLPDISIEVGNRKFSAHKVILAAGSSYFESLFSNGYKEVSENLLKYPELDPEIFNIVLETIYGKDPEFTDLKKEFLFIAQLNYFGVHIFSIQVLVHRKELPIDHFIDYLNLVTTIYPGEIPEFSYQVIHQCIEDGADLSELSDETLLFLLGETNFHPVNLLKFHSRLEKLVEQGHSRELFTLINYSLIPEKYRPDNCKFEGSIPSLIPNEHEKLNSYNKFLIVSEPIKKEKHHISTYWNDPYLWLTKFKIINENKEIEDVLIYSCNHELQVGDIIMVSSYMKTSDGIQYYKLTVSYMRTTGFGSKSRY